MSGFLNRVCGLLMLPIAMFTMSLIAVTFCFYVIALLVIWIPFGPQSLNPLVIVCKSLDIFGCKLWELGLYKLQVTTKVRYLARVKAIEERYDS